MGMPAVHYVGSETPSFNGGTLEPDLFGYQRPSPPREAAKCEVVSSLPATSAWPFGGLKMFGYGLILADCPWSYEMYSENGYAKSPEAHYNTMDDEELARLPVELLASGDCYLIMWAIWPKLDSAMRIMKRWGAVYKTGGAWHKKTRHGKTAFGTGYILRSSCEPFLVGTFGSPKSGSKSIRNLIEAPTREHSRKPDQMRRSAEKLTPSAFRCELFAREPWAGNDVWGLETGKFVNA